MENAKKEFKATVQIGDHVDEVTIYAVSMDAAWQQAETNFGTGVEVTRIRPVVAPNIDRFMVTQ
ncbi:host cell RNA polymerase inhibitor [Pseudomonas rubra]|uniref:Host cell RNA polymerase inhibitor n=1 Tax=Pseudomonas rubra TaxID=2942627 RepID=A0ABT5P6J2_9PSED|nr:host cell RNA polymerase inhibitor [Pseudomonas rubra]MDD1013870.1 host cell RNA polymerase inhibitor [Pseudomonas rubra]MDD1038309.1 host cell RNA polymerase inhibitor [Pseudomonas rubra]MDD1154601.1 host cell RNA polymerase inhibitor [Pseudomonas rubra]